MATDTLEKCPECQNPLHKKHCPGPQCDWWHCTNCNIDINKVGKFIPHRLLPLSGTEDAA